MTLILTDEKLFDEVNNPPQWDQEYFEEFLERIDEQIRNLESTNDPVDIELFVSACQDANEYWDKFHKGVL